jgi:2-desacetyl-2-hydroxyethyl bacteriochlorophyllide A dehydrogenase
MRELRGSSVPDSVQKVSIIIRTFNEEEHLPVLFDRLSEQDYRDFETIVVDSGSVDSTLAIAERRASRVVHISKDDFTFGYSLNRGIETASGSIIAIISAHAHPVSRDWLQKLIEPLRRDDTAMVFGRQEGASTSNFGESMDFARTFGLERKLLQLSNVFANNANSAIRRDLWEEHPFDEGLPGLEDAKWAKYWMEREYQVVYEPTASIYHIHNETWRQVRHRYSREGQAAKWIGLRRRRGIPLDMLLEVRSFIADLVFAARRGLLREKAVEIAKFRFAKLRGSCRGVWDGAKMSSPSYRQKLFFGNSYQAVVISGPRRASLEEAEIPHVKPSEVLVRVAYEGVCGTDLEVYNGTLGYFKTGLASYPIVPGHEMSGRISATGVRVTSLTEGDRVVVAPIQSCGECDSCESGRWVGCNERKEVGVIGRDGGYAEYMVTPARFVRKLPSALSLKEASLCEPMAVVLKGLDKLQNAWGTVDKRHECAVIGAGLIGRLSALVLAHRGHEVTVFDRNLDRLERCTKAGIKTQNDLSNLDEFDALVEATGAQDALRAVLNNSAPASTTLLLGMSYGQSSYDFENLVGYDKTIVGSVGSGFENFDQALELLQKIDTSMLIEKVLPLEGFQLAWRIASRGDALKVVLQVDPSLDEGGIS